MSDYTYLEGQLRTLLVNNMTNYSDSTVVIGDVDRAGLTALENYSDDPRFCVIYNAGGTSEQPNTSFSGAVVWRHLLEVHFFIPILEGFDTGFAEAELKLREDTDEFLQLISRNVNVFGSRRQLFPDRSTRPRPVLYADKPYFRLEFILGVREHLS